MSLIIDSDKKCTNGNYIIKTKYHVGDIVLFHTDMSKERVAAYSVRLVQVIICDYSYSVQYWLDSHMLFYPIDEKNILGLANNDFCLIPGWYPKDKKE